MAASPFIVSNLIDIKNDAPTVLAGKVIKVTMSEDRCATMFDYFTGEALWVTTPGSWTEVTDSVYTLRTRHTLYVFVKIHNLPAPAEAAGTNPKKEEPYQIHRPTPVTPVPKTAPAIDISNIEVVDKATSYKGINYGDGYDKTEFTFNREITEEEFMTFLLANKYRIHNADGWWDNHSKIEGSGAKWTYTWVLAYTD
ncbi:MAG: hypothetical protein NC489_20930 [Ruminococcus flavefaciens]|nr:hypothetical protein [Ruminococcus flavefaciens]